MARPNLSVTVKPHDSAAIPEAFIPGIARLKDLHDRGLLDTIAELIKIRRQGGYCGLDVFIFLALFFTADRLCCMNRSLADFARESLRWQPYLEGTDAGRPIWRSRLSMAQPS